jgi:hypothetical protein
LIRNKTAQDIAGNIGWGSIRGRSAREPSLGTHDDFDFPYQGAVAPVFPARVAKH